MSKFWKKAGEIGKWVVSPAWGVSSAINNAKANENKGELGKLLEIEKSIAEAEASPFSVAGVAPETQQAYQANLTAYAKALKGAEKGLSDAERNVITTDFAQASNMNVENAKNAAGSSLSPYIQSVTNANANKFSLGLAAENENVRRQKEQVAMNYLNMLNQSANPFQQAQNLNFQKQIGIEQALGQAKQDYFFNKRQDEIARRDAQMQLLSQTMQIGGDIVGAGAQATTTMVGGSDRRLKENIKQVGVSNGINLYEFNYKGGETKWVGVMADEVEHIPGAVIQKNGFGYVNYSVVGVEFRKA